MRPRCKVTLDTNTLVDPALQSALEAIDGALRISHGMNAEETATGVLDLNGGRLAMLRADHIEYAASVPKIGILLAYMQHHFIADRPLEPSVRDELGLMIKRSDNEIAAEYSQRMGLETVQQVLRGYGLYDSLLGGLWMGKHYGKDAERCPEPLSGHSHTATVRQLLRFYLLLERGELVSPEASQAMKEIFRSPQIPHLEDKFVLGLAGRPVETLRKSGWWEDWYHDTALIAGPNRRYILVALTHHARGEEYLAGLAAAVDDWMSDQ